jgi:hypothetical protein
MFVSLSYALFLSTICNTFEKLSRLGAYFMAIDKKTIFLELLPPMLSKKTGVPSVATTIGAAAAAATMLFMAPVLLVQGAFAAPTLQGPITCSIVEKNQLRCTADISGLGGAKTATATLTATATATTGCATPSSGSNQPQGLQRTAITVTDTQTVNVEGGRATFDLTTRPLNAEELRTCPDGMTPTIVCVTFSNISIAVVPNSGPSRTFNVAGSLSNC